MIELWNDGMFARNGWKWLEWLKMAGNGWEWLRIAGMAGNGL